MSSETPNLWLDDVRPAPAGWLWAKSATKALTILKTHRIQVASLDHDLGWCESCAARAGLEDGVITNAMVLVNCTHVWTGVDMVKAMIEEHAWPELEVRVHSANPDGAKRMLWLLVEHAPTNLKIVASSLPGWAR